jgi:uncharacterized membrane protein
LELAVTTYELSLFVHITAAVVGLGATFAESLNYAVAIRLDARLLPDKHARGLAINRYLALPTLAVLLGTGLYPASEAGFELGDVWLSAALAIVLALALMIAIYFLPEDRRLLVLLERDIGASPEGTVHLSNEYQRRVLREETLGAVAGLMVIAAILLMVTKPGL